MSAKRSLLIANRKSGSSNVDLEAGIALLKDRGLTLIEHYPDDARQIPRIIHNHGGEIDRVILGGGDGTLNAAAGALVETSLPLGILPLGTANDLARTLQIPASLPEACAIIAAGRLQVIDVGCVNDKYFFNVANIGLGVNVTRRLSRESKARWGWLSYTRGVFGAIKDNRSFSAHITCDGEIIRVRSIQIAVGNGRYYGGGMTVAEGAAIDDHMLDLYSVEPQSLWKLIALAPALRTGQAGNRRGVHCLRGRDIVIRTSRSKSVCTDGEFTTRTPAQFRVAPRALSVYVSSDYLKEAGRADG